MAEPKGLKLTKTEVSQTINLEELTGASFVGEAGLRLAIAQKVLDHIKERTQDENADYNGKNFKDYSAEYRDSTVFKLLKGGDAVDMTLTGSMLSAMDVLENSKNVIKIGFEGSSENIKAFAHMTGFAGHPTIKKGPVRKFFGVTQTELNAIVQENFKEEIDRLKGRNPGLTAQDIIQLGTTIPAIESADYSTLFIFNSLKDIISG